MSEGDLRPAFLMLASCYTELRRRTVAIHGRDTDESRAHGERARSWLQKVHGSQDPDLNSSDPEPYMPATASSTLSRGPASASIPRAIATGGTLSGLPRDMQLLQDRYTSQLTQLAEVIAGKRKADDDMAHERSQRRRLEREKMELEHHLALAQQREQTVQQQLHHEKTSRVAAEQRAAEEEKKRLAAAKALVPVLEAVSQTFARAASGEDLHSIIQVLNSASALAATTTST
jgi:hypothetical protein